MLAGYTGVQLGETAVEKLVWGAFGVLAVISAHFLLALCRNASIVARLLAIPLWLFCFAYVAYSHANFFLQSQQNAGARRAANIIEPEAKLIPTRNLTAIHADLVKVKTDLALISHGRCGNDCLGRRVKLASLQGTLDMLNAEADEFTRWQIKQDRRELYQETLHDDPVVLRLSRLLNVTVTQMALVMCLMFAINLEGIACLCWYVALPLRDSSVTRTGVRSVTTVPALPESGSVVVTNQPPVPSILLDELFQEVKAGRLKLTVVEIRKYCKCAQKNATDFRRQIAERLDADAQLSLKRST